VLPVPELYRGPWSEKLIQELTVDESCSEGYVVRKTEAFSYADFNRSVAKWVRKNHVQTDQHWMHAEVTPNKLKSPDDD